MKLKKVLFMIDSLGGGGAEKVLVNILKRLNPEEYDNNSVFDL